MSSDDCIFCKIIAGEASAYRVYEDEHTLAFMDVFPATDGHVLVVPKRHAENIFELEPEEVAAVARPDTSSAGSHYISTAGARINAVACPH